MAVGNNGAALISSDGRNAYMQRADGGLANTDWLAVDKFDATHAAAGGRGGNLIISSQANVIPDLVAPAGTIAGPTALVPGQAATFTANLADNAGGSGINAGSLQWSAPGIPAATGNPISVAFPSPGPYTLKVAFKDNAGNAGEANLTVNVSAVTPPPAGGNGTGNPTGSSGARTVSVPSGSLTLAGPKTCVASAKTFPAKLTYKAKKGKKRAKVTRVDFRIDGKTVKKDTKSPFKQNLSVKGLKRGAHKLQVKAYLKTGKKKSTKTVTSSFQVC